MSVIYKKNLLLSNDDFQKVGNNFGPGANLSSRLSQINLNTTNNNRWHVKIKLSEPGDYYLKETLSVNCDFTIEGCENTRIIVDFTDNGSYSDDCFIHFNNSNSSGMKTRCNTIIKNVTFGVSENHHWRTLNEQPAILHYIKIYDPESLYIEDVKMSLDGHPITNIDIRNGQNILIKDCVLENYHDNSTQTNTVGGNLWLRGRIENVKIVDNIFKKIGNDEMLAFFGHYSDENILSSDEIPADGICRKNNIIVANNVFEYGEYGTINESVYNDCLISLIDHPSDELIDYCHSFENITFKNNSIVINDLVKRLFFCMNKEYTTIRDVNFVGNNILLNGFTATSSTCQIFELNNINNNVDSNYHIIGNNVFNKAKFNHGNQTSLYFLLQNGGEATVASNVVRIYEDSNDQDQEYRNLIFFWVNYMNTKLTIEHNNLEGLHLFGSISCPTTTGDRIISKMDLLAKGNIVKGGTSIFCHNIGEMNAFIEGNYFESYNFTIVLQDYGSSGNLTFIDNHIVIRRTGNSTFYFSTTGCDASRFCFANNVFEGVANDIMSTILNYIGNQNVTNVNNTLLS